MTTKPGYWIVALAAIFTIELQLTTVHAQGTAFTYQGRLNSGANPATGLYDFQFALSNAPSGGSQIGGTATNLAVGVTNGLFTTTLDFSNVFNGQSVWLAISVRTNAAGGYVGLTPLQPLTPAPYAIYAGAASAAGLKGTIASTNLPGGLGGSGNTTAGNGATVAGGEVNTASGGDATVAGGNGNTASGGDATVAGGTGNTASGNLAMVPGGAGNTAGGNFSFAAGHNAQATNDGSFVWADSQFGNFYSITNDSFNVRAQGGVRFVTGGAGMTVDGNFIAGYAGNTINSGVVNGFIGGGGDSVDGPNVVAGNYSAVLGGVDNTASGINSTVMGGYNIASGNYATAAGGTANAGGYCSTAMGNFVTASGRSSFAVGGGNTASGGWSVAMGGGTLASGSYSMAVGFDANATNNGAFVWGDTQNVPFSSTNNDSFNVRAQGGARFVTSGKGMTVDGPLTASSFSGNGGGLTNLTASQLTSIGNGNSGSSDNVFAGTAGNATTTGSHNTANGYAALLNNTNGNENTANGHAAMLGNTSGSDNVANGDSALFYNTTGSYNTADGYSALNYNGTASGNTADGAEALNSNTSGSNNVAMGFQAGYSIGGSYNIALGYQAGINLTTGSSNIDIGNQGLFTDSSIIRIGSGQTSTFIAGVINGNGGGLANLTASQLNGTIATANLPGGLGGSGNTVSGSQATVAGGNGNTASASYATVAGGQQNTANAQAATVGGGFQNMATNLYATVGGGPNNTAGGYASVVVGGDNNTATGTGATASGEHNTASGTDAFAAGLHAQATNNGAFVWADTQGANFGSTNNDSFNVRAQGGARFVTSGKGMTVDGNVYANGVALTSDRSAKENFAAVQAQTVLAEVSSLPITEWNYKTDRQDVRHLGPMAQDFRAAFGLDGADDKHISVVDEGGVALAAIQGLNEKVESGKQKAETQIQELKAENAELKARLEKLEQLMNEENGGVK